MVDDDERVVRAQTWVVETPEEKKIEWCPACYHRLSIKCECKCGHKLVKKSRLSNGNLSVQQGEDDIPRPNNNNSFTDHINRTLEIVQLNIDGFSNKQLMLDYIKSHINNYVVQNSPIVKKRSFF